MNPHSYANFFPRCPSFMPDFRLRPQPRLLASLLVALATVAVATILSFPLKHLMPHSRGMLFGVAIMFSAWYGGMGSGIIAALLGARCFSYFINDQRAFDFSLEGLARAAVFLLCAVFVSYLTAQRNRALARLTAVNAQLEKALEEIHVLRGIIPICMHCKQVRNDAGSWQAVEGYICEHTDARFSHGVCPHCMDKFYPDVRMPEPVSH